MSESSQTPQTLLSLAGFKASIPQFSDTVLVIIDAQNEYVSGPIQLPDVVSTTAKIKTLLTAVREAKGKVIHIVHSGAAGSLFDLNDYRGQIIDDLTPIDGETVLDKNKPNAFADTTLADTLGAGQAILVAGFMTHMCVSSTVRAALDLGYPATVAADACASRDLPKVGGGVISAKNLHEAELAGLADRFASIVSVKQILEGQN